MRQFKVAAAQMGPVSHNTPRQVVVTRMLDLLRQARDESVKHVVFPELSLTTFFPRDFHEDREAVSRYFESTIPSDETRPLFEFAKMNSVGFVLGYAERAQDGSRFNSSVLVDDKGELIGNYRKVHVPGHVEYEPHRAWQHLERRYFSPGNLGFPVWQSQGVRMGMAICNDRRFPESFRVLGLQGVELVSLGYCTPNTNSLKPAKESPELRQFQSELTLQAGAYFNACYVIAAAKAGLEDGCTFLAGSLVAAPSGAILAKAETDGDELVVATVDLDECEFYRKGIMNPQNRRIDAYSLIGNR